VQGEWVSQVSRNVVVVVLGLGLECSKGREWHVSRRAVTQNQSMRHPNQYIRHESQYTRHLNQHTGHQQAYAGHQNQYTGHQNQYMRHLELWAHS
jgi:hypothetical protein